ncbi:MAG: tripartite tricarboxylate transporter TctB family protein [Thermodesulfobacteriota bacterium]
MRYGGKMMMSLGLIGVAAWVVVTALKWPLRTAVFPVTIGILVFFITIGELFLGLFEGEEATEKKPGGEKVSLERVDQPLPTRKMLWASAWAMGFFLLILLIGFPISIPLFTFLYLRLHGKERWGISLGLSASAFGCFYGLFVWLLHIPFPDGWLQRGLRVLGIV